MKGIANGTCIVKATVNGISKTCKVTVLNPTLSLSSGALTLYKGESGLLTATACPASAISWQSMNTSVATVSSSGLVTAYGPGTAVIVATANGVSASCTVTVSSPTLTISKTALSLPVGESATLSANGITKNCKVTVTKANISLD